MTTDDHLSASRQRNAARKREHPNWPTHKAVFYPPRQPPKILSECVPIMRADEYEATCKYCYEHHRNWWLMDRRDYDDYDVVLCGECEHTSLMENLK